MIGYEILLLLDPELPEERQNEIVARVRENIESSGGTWGAHDVWGRRRLTYDAEPDALAEVSRVLKITDGVIRHLAVKRIAVTGPARTLESSAEHRQDSEDQATPVG